MKRVTLKQLLGVRQNLPYQEQYHYIRKMLEQGDIRPLLASGMNGKKPALYREYWLAEEKKDYSKLEEELKYRMIPQISVDYYLKHPENYEQDRTWVLLLNDYLREQQERLAYSESLNERSFEIWGREKFLSKERGRKILKRCGLTETELNVYSTTEPLAYYSYTKEVPQNLLILENKDTFYSMRRSMLEANTEFFGVKMGTLIYGAGKGILRSFCDFDLCVEPYMKNPENHIYYFGDLDYEGIGIYEKLAGMFEKRWKIEPFCPAYEAMLCKVREIERLPDTKEQQNRNIGMLFFSYFNKMQTEEMKQILESETYVPQEILNITDFLR